MTNYIRLILIFVLVLNYGCGSDSPTDPGDDDNNNYGTPIVTEPIGPAGGTVSTENLELSFPANVISTSSQINIYSSTTGFSSTSVSSAFLITGIPKNFSGGFTVRLKYTGTISGSPYLAVGSDVFTTSANGFEEGYKLFPARDSSGYLCADIPTINSTGESLLKTRNVMNDLPMEVEAVVPMETMSSNNHFKIIHPLNMLSGAINLAGYLEEAYTRFAQMGFDFQTQIEWPLQVIVRDLGDEMYGQYRRRWSEWLEFNQRKINDAAELKTTAAHEFFHIIQSKYDTRSWYSKVWDGNGPQYWLDEATAVWAESMFTTDQNYVSDARGGHEMAPFHGMQKGAESNPAEHGYGMSGMIKFLVDAYGEGIVKNIYDRIRGGSAPVAAVTLSAPDNVGDWWPVFMSYYVLGWVSGDISTALLVSDPATETFTMTTSADTLRQYLKTTTDLSGSLFDFKLNNPSFDPAAMLNLTLVAPSNCTLIVYSYKGSTINYLGYSQTSFPVAGLKALKDDGWHILAMVTDSKLSPPYNGSSSISLTAQVTQPLFDLSIIKYVYVLVNTEIHLDSTAVGKGTSWMEWTASYQTVEGSFNGNTFTAATDQPWGAGTVSVTIDPVNFVITNYSASSAANNNAWSVSGTNVPFFWFQYDNQGVENGLAFFRGIGTDACQSITEHSRSYTDATNGFVTDDFRCNAQSYVSVILYWEAP